MSAGLNLHFAQMLLGDGPAAKRCTKAIDELDRAITQVRFLVLAKERPGDLRSPAGGQPAWVVPRGRGG